MHDLELLRRHGPQPHPFPAEARNAARTALVNEARRHAKPSLDTARRWIPVAAVAAVLALALALFPGGARSTTAVALTPTTPPTFPYTAHAVPASLGAPVFEREDGWDGMFYGPGTDGIAVFVSPDARTFPPDGTMLHWQDGTTHVVVRGTGRYADPSTLAHFRDSLQRRAQPVGIGLTLVPAGYQPVRWKSGGIMTWRHPGTERGTVSVQHEVADTSGLREARVVTVQGAPATAGLGTGGWVVVAVTSDGQPFTLSADVPGLTLDQAVQLAETVTVAR